MDTPHDITPVKPAESVEAQVSRWNSRINSAKRRWEPEFNRMKGDMEFHYGLQWNDQTDLNDDRYVANITIREVNQRVSALYARNPEAEVERRDRLDFALWDGEWATLKNAAMTVLSGQFDPMAMAVIEDYVEGERFHFFVDRVAKTLQTEYEIQVARQEPNFKLQMKQLIRRVVVCGVGYTRPVFHREGRKVLTPNQTQEPLENRMSRVQSLLGDFARGEFDENNYRIEQLRQLINSIHYSLDTLTPQNVTTDEYLTIEFPPATSIIVDPACRIIKGFVGANWIAQEFLMPLDEARAFFNRPDLNTGSGEGFANTFTPSGLKTPPGYDASKNIDNNAEDEYICVYEVFNKPDRTRFFIADGFNDYLLEPEEPTPCIQRFWHHIPLTFNDVETEPGCEVSPFPPSDVRLIRSAQREWNNCSQRLREHRRSNRPKYLTGAGWLTDEDKVALKGDVQVGAVIEVKGAPPGQDINKMLTPFQHSPIDPALYDKQPLERDVQMSAGQSPQDVSAPTANRETATGEQIRETARVTSVSSNSDDVDEHLTEIANVSGEMMLREMTLDTFRRDCGRGAAMPVGDRSAFIDRVFLGVAAASTGKPNKGLEVANYQQIAPILLQAGVNPAFIVEEGVKRLDDRLDVTKAFPLLPPTNMAPMAPQPGEAQSSDHQPPLGSVVSSNSSGSVVSPNSSPPGPRASNPNLGNKGPRPKPSAQVGGSMTHPEMMMNPS